MSSKLPRKAVIAVSSFNGAIYPAGHKTGVFFVEALHPYEVLTLRGSRWIWHQKPVRAHSTIFRLRLPSCLGVSTRS